MKGSEPHGGGPRRRTTEEFVASARSVHGEARYDYSEAEYARASAKVTIICPAHGRFTQSPNSHLSGRGCPACGREDRSRSQIRDLAWFVAKAEGAHGKRYDYSATVYAGQKNKLTITCHDHGPFEQLPANHYSGNGCPDCWQERRADAKRGTLEDFVKRAHEVHGEDRFDYSSTEYIEMKKAVEIACPSHGLFRQTPHKHLQGDGCPKCREPRGEREIRKTLAALGLAYVRQWKHPDLRLQRPLAFDFALPDLRTVIEFDGEQHRRPVRFRGLSAEDAVEAFKATQARDAAKNRWAQKHGWRLIRLTDPLTVDAELRAALCAYEKAAA